jgi:hypothetical protein
MAFNKNLNLTAPASAPTDAFDMADALALELCDCPWNCLSLTKKVRIRLAVMVMTLTGKI